MKIKNLQILNRAGTLPEDGWYQIVPIGEFPVAATGPDGKPAKLMQVIDEKAVSSMAAAFANDGELLVDYDHASLDQDKTSEAAGWIKAVEARADGLFAQIQWTDNGNAAVLNRRFKYVSPVWNRTNCESVGAGRVRPLRMDSLALTNVPNLKGMRPLSNRATGNDPLNNRAEEKNMNELKVLLGLAETATDAEVVAAIKALQANAAEAPALKNRAETAEGKLQAAKTKQLESDADAFCSKYAKHITNTAQVKDQFIKNRAGTESLFAGLKLDVTAAATDALKNRATGNPGEPVLKNRQQQQADAVFKVKNSNPGMKNADAFEQARRENPDLFKEAE
jgi:phage I-like protein